MYSKDPYLVEKDSINLIGFNGRTQYCNIILYPLIHGGINKLTVSSDELVTSQYVNGFKTATLAKITINKKRLEMKREITWKPMNFTYTPQKHMDSGSTRYEIPDSVAAHELTEFPNLLPNTITSFICNGHADINLFEFVVVEKNPSGRALSCVRDVLKRNKASEIQINVDTLKLITNQWLIEINAYGMMDNAKLSNGNTLTLLAV